MTRKGYLRVMRAAAHLVKVLMIEAGSSNEPAAEKVYSAIVQATTGKAEEDNTIDG